MLAFEKRMKSTWANCHQVDPRAEAMPQSVGRKIVTYDRWMAVPWEDEDKPPLPRYLRRELPRPIILDMARFRTSSHRCRVETGRWDRPVKHWRDRVCELCDAGAVQDEKHVLMECGDAALRSIRNNFSDLISDSDGCMSRLMGTHKTVALARFIHSCMRRIDTRDSTCEDLSFVDEDGEQP